MQWLILLLPYLPVAVCVALAARTPLRGSGAVVTAHVAGAVAISYYELIDFLFTHGHQPSFHVVRGLGYADEMVLVGLVTLAWGLSRRQGRLWPLGVVVAALGVALSIRTDWESHLGWASFSQIASTADVRRAYLLHAVVGMLPILVGCLASWFAECRELPRETRRLSS